MQGVLEVNDLILLIVLSLVTYRVARFIILDTLIEAPRDRLFDWIERRPGKLWRKLLELLGCPFCLTIWVAAAAVALTDWLAGDVPMPIWMWLAAAAGALIVWRIVDYEPDPPVEILDSGTFGDVEIIA